MELIKDPDPHRARRAMEPMVKMIKTPSPPWKPPPIGNSRLSASPMNEWPFDQAPNVAAITTRQVIEDGFPILTVVHYADDDSRAFVCGTSNATEDGRVIGMGTALKLDFTLATIADLPPGWCAHRRAVGEPWTREPNSDENVA